MLSFLFFIKVFKVINVFKEKAQDIILRLPCEEFFLLQIKIEYAFRLISKTVEDAPCMFVDNHPG